MLNQRLLTQLADMDTIGEATAFGVVLDQNVGAGERVILVPDGQCLLITHIVLQADLKGGVAGDYEASPNYQSYGVGIYDTAGSVDSTLGFLAFNRWLSVFGGSLNSLSAPPGNVVVWRPNYPLMLPSGWSLRNLAGGGFGNQFAVYGKLVSTEGAKTLGYNPSNTTTDANRTYFFNSLTVTGTPTTAITGRTGKCLRILDVKVRLQPDAGGSTNKLRLNQVDGRTIFAWTNNNPVDMLDLEFSPEIILKSGQGLQVSATRANSASVTLAYEFIDESEVPSDHWWGYVEPDLPTPAVSKVAEFAPSISTVLTCYYPGLDSTKTSPTKGFQHIVRGYTISAQKDTTSTPDQTMLCISTGAAAGQVELADLSVNQSNVQLSPTFTVISHDQCVYMAIDGLNIPCKRDDGSIWIDTIGLGSFVNALTTPVSTDADMDEWSVTVWGKTIPSRFGSPSNRGT